MFKKYLVIFFFLLFSPLISCGSSTENPTEPDAKEQTVVEHFGQLKISGKNIVDRNGDVIALRGMSLFWSQWGGQYYNGETIKWLYNDWKCTIVRAAMGVEGGGYLTNSEVEYQKVKKVIDTCIELGIYVLVDWHDHHAENHLTEAQSFFNRLSKEYGSYPNIIYEVYNEPLAISWKDVLKPYAEAVITTIRANDPDNVIIVGTPNWSQDVKDVINEQINATNIAYSFHFYSSTHKQELRNKAVAAINAGIPLFITEWGMSEASGNGIIDTESLNDWAEFMEVNKLSWCDWSVMNKDETSAAILPSTTSLSGWSEGELSESGRTIREYLTRMNQDIFNIIQK